MVLIDHVFNDTLDTACTDRPPTLTQLLRNHRGRGVGVEKTMSNHLPDHFVGTAVVRFGAALLAH
jgi:hypothetical protein